MAHSETKIIIGIVLGLVLIGGITVGILAAAGVFSSDDTPSTTTTATTATTVFLPNLTCLACSTASGCVAVSGTTNTCNLPSVTFTTGSGTTQFTITSNNWPCHALAGNNGNYVNCPTEYTNTSTIPTVTPCSTGQYYDQNFSSCATYAHTTQPYFGAVGVFGRVATKSAGWSTTNVPQEVVSYDPVPAECGDETAHNCGASYQGHFRYSVPDVVRILAEGRSVTYDSGSSAGESTGLGLDSFNGHVQPQGNYGIYHYHAPPSWDDGTYADYVIGYAYDGYPIMGKNSKLTDGNTAIANYNWYSFDGRYVYNYRYSAYEGGNLDELNGGMFTIDGVSTWAYASTSKYPYCIRNFKGKPLAQ